MSLIHNIDHLARAPGVIAVLVDFESPPFFRGDGAFRPACQMAVCLRQTLDPSQDAITVTSGDRTIVVVREYGQVVAVVVETGHEIRKSLRRMIRRAARAEGRKSDRVAAVDAVIDPPTEGSTLSRWPVGSVL